MKWYEVSLAVQFDNAIKLLQQGRFEAYVKVIRRIRTLMIEREKQMRCDLEMTSVLARYQGIDILLRALAFCAADSDERLERYLREMRRCNQVICRIQRERARRIIAEVDTKLLEWRIQYR